MNNIDDGSNNNTSITSYIYYYISAGSAARSPYLSLSAYALIRAYTELAKFAELLDVGWLALAHADSVCVCVCVCVSAIN